MRKKELYEQVLSYFKATMDDTETELHFSNPFELLVAVILSAQCTDKRINQVTPALFSDYPTPEAMAVSTPEVIYEYIRTVSYPNNKARHLVGMAQMLVKDFHGDVPSTLEELTRLPGVGRKTANVVMLEAFGIADGIAVDTHAKRISNLIGLSYEKDPEKIEQDLLKIFPKKYLKDVNHLLVYHGRNTCIARKPNCNVCPIKNYCNYFKENI